VKTASHVCSDRYLKVTLLVRLNSSNEAHLKSYLVLFFSHCWQIGIKKKRGRVQYSLIYIIINNIPPNRTGTLDKE
jgi:hypothetical protein